MRYMRTRPFAKIVVQIYVRTAGRSLPPMKTLEEIQSVVFNNFNEAINKFPLGKRPKGTVMLAQEASLAMHVGSYTAFGRNTYVLAPSLVSMLDHTDLASVHAGDIRLPFGSIYVSFGEAFDARLPGPPNQIDGAYVSLTNPDHLQILVTSRRLDTRPDRSNQWPFSRDLYYFVPLKFSDAERSFASILDAAIGTEIKIVPDLTEPGPDMFFERPDGQHVVVHDVRYLSEAETTAFAEEGLSTFRRTLGLIVNALCYMTAEPQDSVVDYPADIPPDLAVAIKSTKPAIRDRAKAELLNQSFSVIRLVGSRIPEVTNKRAGSDGGVLQPHWRRGHWRRQPYGSPRTEIRLIWIKPTIVRADRGEPEVGHVYDVSDVSRGDSHGE